MLVRLIKPLASLRIAVAGLFLLMVLTIWGTFYQTEFGLFRAQQRFYQSWFFLAGGFLPFPGAQTVMTVLFINLSSAILLLTLKGRLRWGLVISHLGLLIMLAAGAFTFYLGEESHLTLLEGEGSNVAASYQDWELSVWPVSSASERDVSALDASALKAGRSYAFPGGRFSIAVEEFHHNSMPAKDEEVAGGGKALQRVPEAKDPAQNRPGLIAAIVVDGKEQERLVLWGGDERPAMVDIGGTRFGFGLRRRMLPLPAVIQLADFRREMHPGSGIAKSFSSQVMVKTGEGVDRKVLISMNKPLRLQGFTFYQSSYSQLEDGREASTLSVVKNYARLMPYVATGVTVIGMILHFVGVLIRRLEGLPPREEAVA
jgi:hypothetical protein